MRILVLGGTGMLGFQVFKTCVRRNLDVFSILRSKKLLECKIPDFVASRIVEIDDVRNMERMDELIQKIQPTHLINCIGIVKQSNLANDYIESITLNALLPHQLQKLGQKHNFRLIQISTDCVFNGKKGNYQESDQPDAEDLYGKSKHMGEVDYGSGITIRTSIIGHELSSSTHGLIEWFLAESGPVKGFKKAIFSGLTTLELTNVILDYIIPTNLDSGLYQVAAKPISKFDLIKLTALVYGKQIHIEPEEKFILDRSLDGSRFATLTGYKAPNWEDLLSSMKDDWEDSKWSG